jgi:hypothetical protein
MTTNEPPTTESPAPPPPPPPPPARRSRLRSRGFIIGATIVAGLLVGGVVAALLIPDRDRGWFGPGDGRGDRVSEMDHRGGPWQGGPWQGGPGRGGDRGGYDEGDPFAFGDGPVVTGTVVSAGNGTLVVAVDGGAQRTLRTDGDTRVVGAGNNALGDLQTGERVVVRVQGTGDAATAVTVWAPQARVTGTVTALTGDRATVVSVEGFTVAADVSALTQKPAVGDVVVLTGVAADGSTIRAEGIRVLPRAS